MRSRTYDKEFKLNAIQLLKGGKSASQICRDLGIPESTFSGWVKEHKKEKGKCFNGSGNPKSSNEELLNLKKAYEDMKLERDILKKALAIFSQQK